MEKELNLVLNLTNSKFDVKMIKIRGFQNPKKPNSIWSKPKFHWKKKVKIRSKVLFEIKNWTTLVPTSKKQFMV
jgi:hypothetical protein